MRSCVVISDPAPPADPKELEGSYVSTLGQAFELVWQPGLDAFVRRFRMAADLYTRPDELDELGRRVAWGRVPYTVRDVGEYVESGFWRRT